MKLYVIRHGESETNQAHQYTGWADVRLTEKGVADAMGARERLAGISFDKVYTSDLIRAKQTAETALPGCVYEESALLREIDLGSLSRQPIGCVTVKNLDFTPWGGENREMLYARAQTFLRQVEQTDAKTVAVFSHAGILRAILCTVLQAPLQSATFCCSNCTTAIFDYTDGKWRLHSWINP